MTTPAPDQLPPVRMDAGLLLCPACGSMDLLPEGGPGELLCEACGVRSKRHADQCQRCGSRGVFTAEKMGYPAPGQAPSEVQPKQVRECDACGYVSR